MQTILLGLATSKASESADGPLDELVGATGRGSPRQGLEKIWAELLANIAVLFSHEWDCAKNFYLVLTHPSGVGKATH